jgi:hypothetical protein
MEATLTPKAAPGDLEEFEKQFLATNRCELYLQDDGSLPEGLWAYKVYVNGNVRGRAPGVTRRTPKKLYARLPAGNHRVVIRDYDHRKTDRAESNTLQFTVKEETEVVVQVSRIEGRLSLSFVAPVTSNE